MSAGFVAPETCARCGSRQEKGFLIDRGDMHLITESTWASGEPNRSFWRGIVVQKDQRTLPVSTYRCTRCGLLESYATE